MRTRGQFSKPAPFNYQSHQSLQKFRKVAIEQRAQQVVQDIFKIKVKGEPSSKLIMAKNVPQSKQQEIKQLKKQIKLIQSQLKKKVLENPILSRIFKTKQPTNGQMAHLDLYLEFVRLKEEQQNNQKKIDEGLEFHKQKQMTYELEISHLKDEMQRREQNFITQIEKASQKFAKLQKEFQRKISDKQKTFEKQTIERESKIQDNNLILQELKRKNHKLAKQNKDYEAKLNQYKKSQQQRIKSLKTQFESYKQKASDERTSQQEQIQKSRKHFKTTQETLKSRISSLENELAEKTLQIQELDRFIELQKESFQTQMHELQTSYETELRKIKDQSEELIMNLKEESESQIKNLIKSEEEKLRQASIRYEKQIKTLKQKAITNESRIHELQTSLDQKQKTLKKLQQDIKKYSQQTQMQISTLKATNKCLTEEKQTLTKKLTQSQLKTQKNTKEIQFLTHQKNQMHSKYEKGLLNTENDIKHYQTIIDELQRKIYMLSNDNIGLKKALEQKTSTQNKVKQFSRVSEETYQQKYKAIGRIEEIKHKLQNYMISDLTRGFSNNLSVPTNNYRNNNSNHQPSVSLTDSIEGLTIALDKLCDHFSSLNQAIESFRKQKQEDEREIESILNHFLDMEERQADLEEAMISYINLRKELNKQQTVNSGIYCGEEYLLQKKRQICQFVIEKLIQLKVIKQYSSADQAVSSYRLAKDHHQTKRSEDMEFNSHQSSNNYFLSSINNTTNNSRNSNNSRRNLKNLVMEEQYRSNQDFVNNEDCYDSLDMTKRTNKSKILFEGNQNAFKQRKSSLVKPRQSSKPKGTISSKYAQRMSTQPSKCEEDIEQQSTYEIMDENVDYGNVRRREMSKSKQVNEKVQYNSGNLTATKEQLNKKYREQIKQKLMSGKGKRESGMGLSKEDIEKKYFLR